MNMWKNKSFEELYQHYIEIWKSYEKYGKIVLEVDLKREEEDIKNVFLTSNSSADFKENIFEFWEENYKIIINGCSDIPKVYSTEKNKKIHVYPVGETCNLGVQVSIEFLEKIQEHKCDEDNITYVFVDDYVYQISFGKDIFDYIIINNRKLIKDILKDN